jgi:hypothetical protein
MHMSILILEERAVEVIWRERVAQPLGGTLHMHAQF